MTPPVRLALFTDSLHPSGVGRVIETLARHLPRQRYTLFLVCAAHPGANDLARRMEPYVAGIARHTLREETECVPPCGDEEDLPALHALVRQLREWKIDLFHNHIGATWEGSWGTLAARCAEVPVVVATDHLPNVLLAPSHLEHRRRMNRLLDRIFAVSESVRQSLLTAGLARPDQVVTVENGVDEVVPRCTRAEARRELEIPAGPPVVLFLGRLVEQKDPTVLLHALYRLKAGGEPVLALVAGDGPLREPLQELRTLLGLGDSIRFLGNRPDVDRLLAAADALVMPSRFEGLPLAALEAMSLGLPIVGCEASGVLDAVAHGVNGWLAPIGDPEELARGILLAASAGTPWGAASRHRYVQRFTARAMVERHEAQYAAALAVAAVSHELRLPTYGSLRGEGPVRAELTKTLPSPGPRPPGTLSSPLQEFRGHTG